MSTKKEQVEQLENHDPAGAQNEQMAVFMRQSNANEVKTGATCAMKRIHEGSDMVDKNTKEPIIDPATGEPRRFPDTHYVTLTFDGGEIETKVTKQQFDMLQEGHRYMCTGRLSPVKSFGQTVILPVYYAFTMLY